MRGFVSLQLSGGRIDWIRHDWIVEVVERYGYGSSNDQLLGSTVHTASGREIETIEQPEDILERWAQASSYFNSEDGE